MRATRRTAFQILTVGLLALAGMTRPAFATHFRYTHISWDDGERQHGRVLHAEQLPAQQFAQLQPVREPGHQYGDRLHRGRAACRPWAT